MTSRTFGKRAFTLIASAALAAALLSPAVGGAANAADDPPTDAPCGVSQDRYTWYFNNCAPQNGRSVMVKYFGVPNQECVPARTQRSWSKMYVTDVVPTDKTCEPVV